MRAQDRPPPLPVSARTLDDITGDPESLDDALEALSSPGVAALLVLGQVASRNAASASSLARAIPEALDICLEIADTRGLDPLRDLVRTGTDPEAIDLGRTRFLEQGGVLLDDDTIARREFLTANGRWDRTFGERYHALQARNVVRLELSPGQPVELTAEQGRIYREMQAQEEEHVHVQGYAGTGKSLLIRSLVALVRAKGAHVLLLAERRRQLDGIPLDAHGAGRVDKQTFAELARRAVPRDPGSAAYRNLFGGGRQRAPLSDIELASVLDIRDSGAVRAPLLARAVREQLFVFCRGGDDAIDASHLPRHYERRFDATTRAVVLEHARALWSALVTVPAGELVGIVRDHHRVKWAALSGCGVPATYTHVLVDESHDLSGAVRQLLGSMSQARLTFGDEHQNLAGFRGAPPTITRQREMVHSVRSGQAVEALINPVIASYPGRGAVPFVGNRSIPVDIVHYDAARAPVPEAPAVVLVNDTWELFEWVQRLAAVSAGGSIGLFAYRPAVDQFVRDCIALRADGTTPRHVELLRFASWDEVVRRYRDNASFARVERLLAKGYAYTDWERTGQRLTGNPSARYCVGLIRDTLNREFDSVMLAPGIVGDAESRRHRGFRPAVYVALTRARRRLILPDTLRHWIEEIASGLGREPTGPADG